MHILWAHWRKTYIRALKNNDCVFCAMQDAECSDHKLILYQGLYHFVVLNKYPYTTGHLMVVPYCHIQKISDLQKDALEEWLSLTDTAISWLIKAFQPHGFNLGMNIGKSAGAGVEDHLHLHIVPRWTGDTNFMSTLNDTRIQSQSLEEVCHEIKQVI
jgi:ATP adenylyltransferase